MSDAPTLEELQTRLTQAQEAVAEAERKLGSASLDGKGQASAQKTVDSAKAEVQQIEQAIEELQRRDVEAAAQAAVEGAAAERIALYQWSADFTRRYAEVLRRRDALAQATQELCDLSTPRRIGNLKLHGSERIVVDGIAKHRTLTECELDYPLINGLPGPVRGKEWKPDKEMTAERCEELAARADELVKAEKRGEAESVTVTGPQWEAEYMARRRQRRAEAKAQQEAELQARTQDAKPRDDGGEVQGRGSDIPVVMHSIERQQAGSGDPR